MESFGDACRPARFPSPGAHIRNPQRREQIDRRPAGDTGDGEPEADRSDPSRSERYSDTTRQRSSKNHVRKLAG